MSYEDVEKGVPQRTDDYQPCGKASERHGSIENTRHATLASFKRLNRGLKDLSDGHQVRLIEAPDAHLDVDIGCEADLSSNARGCLGLAVRTR